MPTRKAPAKPAEIPDFRPRVLTGMGGTEAAEIADGYVEYAQVYRTYAWVRKAIDERLPKVPGLQTEIGGQDAIRAGKVKIVTDR